METSDHTHCVSCILGFACRQQETCAIIYCSNGCGVFTHSCKMEDHMKEVCPLARVSCPNQLFGCPKVTTRRKLSAHLFVCPAYVISCPYGHVKLTTNGCSRDGHECGEVMRRDTFSDHMRGHSDIHEGFDGWLEVRCPLSFLGCPFTFRRWRPHAAGHKVEFSDEQGAFVTSWEPQGGVAAAAAESCHLLRLPPELLLHIGAYLDGLSLNSLALTCKTLRDVCELLLRSKGCVSRSWVSDENGKWTLDNQKRWRLNRSTEAIRRWTIAENGLSALHNHLKECPFNEREEKSAEPIKVMLIKAK